MILKQKAFQKLVQIMTRKENKGEKVPHRGIEPACITNTQFAGSGTGKRQTHSATISSISRSVITCTVQMNRASWLRQNNDEKFCKITKICLLETK